MTVWLSKMIGVDSLQLTRLSIILKLSIFGGLFVHLVYYTSYMATVDGSSRIDVLMWAGMDGDNLEESSVDETLCYPATMWQKDYIFNPSWTYVNNTCMPLCPPSQLMDSCVTADESSTFSVKKNWVFWATYLKQEFFAVGPEAKDVPASRGAFVMETHRRKAYIKYGYSLPDKMLYSEDSPTSTDNILTLLVGADGEVLDAMEPSPHVELSWTGLLALTEQPDLMDSALPAAGKNLLPDAFMPEGPLGRLAGLLLELQIDCRNDHSKFEVSVPDEWDGPICTMAVVPPEIVRPWPTFERNSMADAEKMVRRRIYHGLYLKSVPIGTFYFFDFETLYFWSVAGMVVMRVPDIIIRILSLHFLGHLSHIYKRVVLERFCIVRELAVFASSVVAGTHAFDAVSNGAQLTQLGFAEWMAEMTLREVRLDTSKAAELVKTCYIEMLAMGDAQIDSGRNSSLYATVIGQLCGKTEAGDLEPAHHTEIDVYTWLCSVMASSRITIPHVAKLFDKDRHPSYVEWLFMPAKIRARLVRSTSPSTQGLTRSNACKELSYLEMDSAMQRVMTRARASLAMSATATARSMATNEDQDEKENKEEQKKPEAQEEQEEQNEQEEQEEEEAEIGDVRAEIANLRRQTWHTVHALSHAVRSLNEDVWLLRQAKEAPDRQLTATAVSAPLEPPSALVGTETKRCLDELTAHLNALEVVPHTATEALPRQQPATLPGAGLQQQRMCLQEEANEQIEVYIDRRIEKSIEERIERLERELSAQRHHLDDIAERFGALLVNMTKAPSSNALQRVVGTPHGNVHSSGLSSMSRLPPPPSIETTVVLPPPSRMEADTFAVSTTHTTEAPSTIVALARTGGTQLGGRANTRPLAKAAPPALASDFIEAAPFDEKQVSAHCL
eukprot:NODE_517_length_2973_cov_25.653900.p1 GENE.NODE_517_length_2973_cov_25.653900~~NODE_517_length_2973_cov_25.653900.p1  ORF type:complete len:898 (-),score=158.14 NODE_517_length_2973_cov_25.653900:164-2857(-)